MKAKTKNPRTYARAKRKKHVRKHVQGTTERPRLSVYRSNKHIYAQIIDDKTGVTLAGASTLSKELQGDLKGLSKKEAAKKVGEHVGKLATEKKVKQVVFDRNGFLYWGRVASVADGAREAGLAF